MVTGVGTLGVVGAGVIGSGWAVRALAHGLDVIAWDVAADWQARLAANVANAWPAVEKLGLSGGASPHRLRCARSLAEACAQADFIQENAPEQLPPKRRLLAEIDALAAPETIIASSTSGLVPSALQADCRHKERLVVGHPFNPVYLLPLVEVLGGAQTSTTSVDRAVAHYTELGMHPLKLRREIDGFLADRLQEALWREALHLVNDDVASTADLDAAIIYGPGLRWAFMGTFLTYHLAGGDAGMRDFLRQFGPALKLPWTRLEAPDLTDELIEKVASGAERQAAGRSVKELERLRDDCLVAIMAALRRFEQGAGELSAPHKTLVRPVGNVGNPVP